MWNQSEAPADAPLMTPDEWLALLDEMQRGYCPLCGEPGPESGHAECMAYEQMRADQ